MFSFSRRWLSHWVAEVNKSTRVFVVQHTLWEVDVIVWFSNLVVFEFLFLMQSSRFTCASFGNWRFKPSFGSPLRLFLSQGKCMSAAASMMYLLKRRESRLTATSICWGIVSVNVDVAPHSRQPFRGMSREVHDILGSVAFQYWSSNACGEQNVIYVLTVRFSRTIVLMSDFSTRRFINSSSPNVKS